MPALSSPTRTFVVLAYADEVLTDPALLAEYGRAFRADDDVTLAIFAPGADGEEIARALGPQADIDADVLLLAVPPEDAWDVAAGVDSVYTRRAPLGIFARLPHAGDARELRRTLLPDAPERDEDAGTPNYLLLTFDSCRYDVLREARTPVLDSYAEIVQAQTPANFTYAAHQAFFVGMFPNAIEPRPYHNRFVNQLIGLSKVGEIHVIDKACAHRVASDVNLVAGLAAQGYQTVGAGAMNWFKQVSLTQSFEKFSFTGTNADAQIDYLLAELDPSRPFFGFVNFGETHDPFDFAGKPDSCPIEVQSRVMVWPPTQNGVPVGRDSEAWDHQRRSAEFLDARLPRLFAGLPGNTVVILCGDHGEAFGEDGYWGHGVNHPSVHQVPLAIFRLDRKPL